MKNVKRRVWWISILMPLVFISACEKQEEEKITLTSPTVASVNGEQITEADVEFMLTRTFSQQDLSYVDENLRKKVLESLVASKAMKQLFLKEVTLKQKEEIAQMVKAYEEELYVKSYLQQHITPAPVTVEMVQEYYSQHPDEFGGEISREIELLKAMSLSDQQRDRLLNEIPAIRNSKNWSAASQSLQQKFSLEYQYAQAAPGLLHPAVEQALTQLQQGETSDVVYVDNQLYLVRVIKIQQSPPKPLASVSDDIRKKLATVLLREAVKKATDDVMRSTDIKYENNPKN